VGEGLLSPATLGADRVPGGCFPRVEGVLRVGGEAGPSLEALSAQFGTPLYVYDAGGIESRIQAYQAAFRDVDFLLAYSVKANGNLGVLSRIAGQGAGADIVSAGELARALAAGIPPKRIVFAGAGKTRAEMELALEAGILAFHVESAGELEALDAVATARGVRAPVGIRVNPDIHTDTPHAYTRTGHAATKFGIAVDQALDLFRWARDRPFLHLKGIDVHIGSQILEVAPYRRALETVLGLIDTLKAEGIVLETLDLGGGFGVGYEGGAPLAPEALAEVVVPMVRGRELRLILEPGRSIVAEAGVLVTQVLYRKEAGGKTFVITDAGMTELLRPSHYDGWHAIVPVSTPDPHRERRLVDVVGPVCETGDFLARDREMVLPEPGELLAVATAGAYGFTMASNYNARPRPAEVMVVNGVVHEVRQRETVEDLFRGESMPSRLPSPVSDVRASMPNSDVDPSSPPHP
jgi:diaminopimelate decarboxylase